MDGKGLNGVVHAVAGAQELEHSLIYRAGHVKAELRVQAVAHIGKILVRQYLQKHAWNARGAAFAVGTVPNLAARPQGILAHPEVVHNLRLDKVAQEPAGHSGRSVLVLGPFL